MRSPRIGAYVYALWLANCVGSLGWGTQQFQRLAFDVTLHHEDSRSCFGLYECHPFLSKISSEMHECISIYRITESEAPLLCRYSERKT